MKGTSRSKVEPSQNQEKEGTVIINKSETTQTLFLSKLQDIQRNFIHHPGKHILTWQLWWMLKVVAKKARKPNSWDPSLWKGSLTEKLGEGHTPVRCEENISLQGRYCMYIS